MTNPLDDPSILEHNMASLDRQERDLQRRITRLAVAQESGAVLTTSNPLDDLVVRPVLPPPPRAHSSGRRELRAALLSRPQNVIARPANEKEHLAGLQGKPFVTRPIRRAVGEGSRPAGMSAGQWKRLRKAVRKAARNSS